MMPHMGTKTNKLIKSARKAAIITGAALSLALSPAISEAAKLPVASAAGTAAVSSVDFVGYVKDLVRSFVALLRRWWASFRTIVSGVANLLAQFSFRTIYQQSSSCDEYRVLDNGSYRAVVYCHRDGYFFFDLWKK